METVNDDRSNQGKFRRSLMLCAGVACFVGSQKVDDWSHAIQQLSEQLLVYLRREQAKRSVEKKVADITKDIAEGRPPKPEDKKLMETLGSRHEVCCSGMLEFGLPFLVGSP